MYNSTSLDFFLRTGLSTKFCLVNGIFSALLVVYHSQSGSCAALAFAAFEGACAEVPKARIYRACDVGAREIGDSQGLLLVCAENSGRLAGGAKDLLDRVFYPLLKRRCTLPYALLVSAGNDGRGAVAEAQRILSGIPFAQALEPSIVRGKPSVDDLHSARALGEGFAAGIVMGVF